MNGEQKRVFVTELHEIMMEKAGLSRASAERALAAALQGIHDITDRGDMLIIRRFGTFAVRTRKASKTVNPQTGEPMHVPAAKILRFKGSKR